MTIRRFPTLWHVEQIPGGGPGLVEASGQAFGAYEKTRAAGGESGSAETAEDQDARFQY